MNRAAFCGATCSVNATTDGCILVPQLPAAYLSAPRPLVFTRMPAVDGTGDGSVRRLGLRA